MKNCGISKWILKGNIFEVVYQFETEFKFGSIGQSLFERYRTRELDKIF